jgi:hypothetical protein
MKDSPYEQMIAERLKPGVLVRDGFLGTDPRCLSEILTADDAVVRRMGATHARVAASLARVLDAAVGGLGTPVALDEEGGLTATYDGVRGNIPCPWGDGRMLPKGEVLVEDDSGRPLLRFTALSVHLVAAHGFYEGLGSRYRVDPEQAILLFGLETEE